MPTTRTLLVLLSLCATNAFASAYGHRTAPNSEMLIGSLLDAAWIGAEHMLTGYDHLLFLLGVMLFSRASRRSWSSSPRSPPVATITAAVRDAGGHQGQSLRH